jgi:glycosyltransferase involved in cell wall biosynthesis
MGSKNQNRGGIEEADKMDEKTEPVDISVVIPIYDEGENLRELYAKLSNVLPSISKNYEIIFVDDGSTDNTFTILKGINMEDKKVKAIRLRRNFGQTAAISAGFDYSKGDVIITMDGDLQNDPGDIHLLLEKIEEGYDIVSGWRTDRKDPFFTKKLPSKFSNWLASKLTGVKLHDFGCTLKAFRREVVENINLYGEMHRYIPALASWMGISISEVKVRHHSRQHGKSKYGITRLMRGMLDLITVKFLLSYSTRPLQLFGIPGIISFFAGFVIGAYLTIDRLFFGISLADRPLLLLAVLLVFLGVQFITMGLLGEIITRTYYEVQGKPIYAVKEIVEGGLKNHAYSNNKL